MAANLDFLGSLSEDCRRRMLIGARSFTLPAGTLTHHPPQEAVADVVEAGLVRVFVSSADGRQASFAYIHARALYGSPTVLGVAMSTAAQTVTDTSLIRLDAGHVLALYEEDLEIARAIGHAMAVRLAQTARLVAVRSLGTVRERLAYDLLERACDQQLRDGTFSLRITQEELADSIGSAREVVGRTLAGLRRSGCVRTRPGVVEVVNVERLSAIVHGLIA